MTTPSVVLHTETEIVHCLLSDYKNVLEMGCEHKQDPGFLCFNLLHFQSLSANKHFSQYAGPENSVWIRKIKQSFLFWLCLIPLLLSCPNEGERCKKV